MSCQSINKNPRTYIPKRPLYDPAAEVDFDWSVHYVKHEETERLLSHKDAQNMVASEKPRSRPQRPQRPTELQHHLGRHLSSSSSQSYSSDSRSSLSTASSLTSMDKRAFRLPSPPRQSPCTPPREEQSRSLDRVLDSRSQDYNNPTPERKQGKTMTPRNTTSDEPKKYALYNNTIQYQKPKSRIAHKHKQTERKKRSKSSKNRKLRPARSSSSSSSSSTTSSSTCSTYSVEKIVKHRSKSQGKTLEKPRVPGVVKSKNRPVQAPEVNSSSDASSSRDEEEVYHTCEKYTGKRVQSLKEKKRSPIKSKPGCKKCPAAEIDSDDWTRGIRRMPRGAVNGTQSTRKPQRRSGKTKIPEQ